MKDFRDSDLVPGASRDFSPLLDRNGNPAPPVSELSLSRMGRQKVDLTNQMTGAVSEMERLRMRQEELEKEKNQLQELVRRQEEYERSKRDIIEKLGRGIIQFEKEETQATRMAQLLLEARTQFNQTLLSLKEIDEEKWPDDSFREELDSALARVESAKSLYKKAMARIDASSWHRTGSAEVTRPVDVAAGPSEGSAFRGGFGFWFRVGLAVSLPLIVVVILAFLGYLWASGCFRAVFSGL